MNKKGFGIKHLIGIALFVTAFQAGLNFLLGMSSATKVFQKYT